MFRAMRGLADTIKLATETAKLSAAGATAVGAQAGEAMKTAVSADTERRKIAADLEKAKVQAATDLAKAKLGKPIQDKNITEAGAVVNKEEELKKKQQEQAKAAGTGGSSGGSGAGSSGGATGGGGSGSGTGGTPAAPPRSTGNSALDRIIGNDEALRSFIGLSADSPVPTPAVTDEGVPLQTWDVHGPTSFMIPPLVHRGTGLPDARRRQENHRQGQFRPRSEDLTTLLLGERKVFATGFDQLLRSLSLVPAGSVKTLNIVAVCQSAVSLDFLSELVFTSTGDFGDRRPALPSERPLQNLTLAEAVALLAAPEFNLEAMAVKLSDVRKAFPVDGEVRIFNLSNPLREDFVQALANVFLLRTSAFARKPVRVLATVIAETGETEEALDTAVLAKKLTIGFLGDPVPFEAVFFEHLLQQDRAQTGLFTAFPRR